MFASGYTPGGVAGSLGGKPQKAGKKKEKKDKHDALAKLFDNPVSTPVIPTPAPPAVSISVSVTKKNGKRKIAEASTGSESNDGGNGVSSKKKKQNNPSQIPRSNDKQSPSKLGGVSNAKKETAPHSEDKVKLKRPKRRKKEKENRTVFVGNVPLSATKKSLQAMFKKFGNIESIRFRSAVGSDPKMPKKGAVIKKEFHPDRHSMNAYVVFADKEAAKESLQLNGTVHDSHTIRVDIASHDKKHKHNCSVFVGNLPFDVDEDPIRQHFEDCGEVENVRLIRDKKIGLGKGFGYVLFKDKDAVELAVRLDGKDFQGRRLRVQRSVNQPKPQKKDEMGKSSGAPKKLAKPAARPAQSEFQGMQAQPPRDFKKKQKLQKKFKSKQSKDKPGNINKMKKKFKQKGKADNARKRILKKEKKKLKS